MDCATGFHRGIRWAACLLLITVIVTVAGVAPAAADTSSVAAPVAPAEGERCLNGILTEREDPPAILSDADADTAISAAMDVMSETMQEELPWILNPLGDSNGEEEALDLKHIYCHRGGEWRRGDILAQGCHIDGFIEGMDEGLIPDQCWGMFPTANYDIGYVPGAANDITSKLYGWFTDLFFTVGKSAAGLSLYVIGWSYGVDRTDPRCRENPENPANTCGFQISDYRSLGIDLANKLDLFLVSNKGFQLYHLMFLLLIGWVAFNTLRGKVGMAAGELLTSVVLMTLAAALLLNLPMYMDSTLRLMEEASIDLLLVGQGKDPTQDGVDRNLYPVVSDMQQQLHEIFVEEPYDYINWGHPLTGACATARNQALGIGPHGGNDVPRQLMNAAGCEQEENFNAVPNGYRLMASILYAVAAVIAAFAIIGTGLPVALGKLTAVVVLGLSPFAALTAGAPAGLRRATWKFVTIVYQVVVVVIGMSLVLVIMLISLAALHRIPNVSLTQRFIVMIVLVYMLGVLLRRGVFSGSQASAGRLADNLTNLRVGGGGTPWQGASGGQGLPLGYLDSGLRKGLAAAGRGLGYGGYGAYVAGIRTPVLAPLRMGGRHIQGRFQRRDTAKRALNNLVTMEYLKGAPLPNWKGKVPLRRRRPPRDWDGRTRPRPGGGSPTPGGGGGTGPLPAGGGVPVFGRRGGARPGAGGPTGYQVPNAPAPPELRPRRPVNVPNAPAPPELRRNPINAPNAPVPPELRKPNPVNAPNAPAPPELRRNPVNAPNAPVPPELRKPNPVNVPNAPAPPELRRNPVETHVGNAPPPPELRGRRPVNVPDAPPPPELGDDHGGRQWSRQELRNLWANGRGRRRRR